MPKVYPNPLTPKGKDLILDITTQQDWSPVKYLTEDEKRKRLAERNELAEKAYVKQRTPEMPGMPSLTPKETPTIAPMQPTGPITFGLPTGERVDPEGFQRYAQELVDPGADLRRREYIQATRQAQERASLNLQELQRQQAVAIEDIEKSVEQEIEAITKDKDVLTAEDKAKIARVREEGRQAIEQLKGRQEYELESARLQSEQQLSQIQSMYNEAELQAEQKIKNYQMEVGQRAAARGGGRQQQSPEFSSPQEIAQGMLGELEGRVVDAPQARSGAGELLTMAFREFARTGELPTTIGGRRYTPEEVRRLPLFRDAFAGGMEAETAPQRLGQEMGAATFFKGFAGRKDTGVGYIDSNGDPIDLQGFGVGVKGFSDQLLEDPPIQISAATTPQDLARDIASRGYSEEKTRKLLAKGLQYQQEKYNEQIDTQTAGVPLKDAKWSASSLETLFGSFEDEGFSKYGLLIPGKESLISALNNLKEANPLIAERIDKAIGNIEDSDNMERIVNVVKDLQDAGIPVLKAGLQQRNKRETAAGLNELGFDVDPSDLDNPKILEMKLKQQAANKEAYQQAMAEAQKYARKKDFETYKFKLRQKGETRQRIEALQDAYLSTFTPEARTKLLEDRVAIQQDIQDLLDNANKKETEGKRMQLANALLENDPMLVEATGLDEVVSGEEANYVLYLKKIIEKERITETIFDYAQDDDTDGLQEYIKTESLEIAKGLMEQQENLKSRLSLDVIGAAPGQEAKIRNRKPIKLKEVDGVKVSGETIAEAQDLKEGTYITAADFNKTLRKLEVLEQQKEGVYDEVEDFATSIYERAGTKPKKIKEDFYSDYSSYGNFETGGMYFSEDTEAIKEKAAEAKQIRQKVKKLQEELDKLPKSEEKYKEMLKVLIQLLQGGGMPKGKGFKKQGVEGKYKEENMKKYKGSQGGGFLKTPPEGAGNEDEKFLKPPPEGAGNEDEKFLKPGTKKELLDIIELILP